MLKDKKLSHYILDTKIILKYYFYTDILNKIWKPTSIVRIYIGSISLM